MRRSHFSDHALPSTVIPWVIDLGSERNKHLQKTHSISDIVLSVEHTLFHWGYSNEFPNFTTHSTPSLSDFLTKLQSSGVDFISGW